jgi:hypothetical protein
LISGGTDGLAKFHLSFRNRVHNLNAGQKNQGTARSLEPQHGPRASLDYPMVLLDHVIEKFGLADLDGRFTIGIGRFERGENGAAPVGRHGVGFPVLINRFLEIPAGCSLVTMGICASGIHAGGATTNATQSDELTNALNR